MLFTLLPFLPLGKIYEDVSYERMLVDEASQNNQINSFKASAGFSASSKAFDVRHEGEERRLLLLYQREMCPLLTIVLCTRQHF